MNRKKNIRVRLMVVAVVAAMLVVPGAVGASMKAEAKPELAMKAEANPELASGFYFTLGGSHTDPPDVEGVYAALRIMGSSDDGSMSDPPDVDKLV